MSIKRVVLVVLVASGVMLAVGVGPRLAGNAYALPPVQEPDPTGVTIPYPGRLAGDAGQPVAEGAYDFTFALYDAETGGESLWSEVQEDVAVQDGAFSVLLGDVEPIPAVLLDGDERWLAVGVRGPRESGFTALTPRQRLSAASRVAPAGPATPALTGLTCAHTHEGETWSATGGTQGLHLSSQGGYALEGWSSGNIGVLGISTSSAVFMPSGMTGLYGIGDNYGVQGYGNHGAYFSGSDDHQDLILGGSVGRINTDPSDGNSQLYLSSNGDVTIKLDNDSGGGGANVLYIRSRGHEIARMDDTGNLTIQGSLTKSGGGFKIDHPLDPENQYLNHSFVESPDMMNIYNGNVTLDANGEAWVELLDWFEALNKDFRYQLTCIGGFAPVYVAQEIQDNRFRIAGGTPGMKVSWQVTGIRHDSYAEAHPIPVEEEKPPEEQGTYLHPVECGKPEALGWPEARGVR